MKNKIVLSILLILGIFSFADEEGKWKEAYNGENSYYFGENTWVDGNNAYSIGNDNYIYGNNNQVHGDKNKVGGENSRIDKNLVFGNNNEIYPDPVNKATREYKVYTAFSDKYGQTNIKIFSIKEGEKVNFNVSVDGAKLVWWNNAIEKPIKSNSIIFGRFIEDDKTETKHDELYSKLSILIDCTGDIVKESKKFLMSSDDEKEEILEKVNKAVDDAKKVHGSSNDSYIEKSINECEGIIKIFTEEEPKQNDTPNVNIAENKSTPDFIGNIIKGNDNLVIGQGNAVFGTNVKLGEKNKSSVNNNIILGSNITNTDVNNAIVIGNGSKAIENAVSIGNDGITRQIKYVKAGTDDTDAVNVSQLKEYVKANSFSAENYYTKPEVDKKIDFVLGGVSSAVAMANLPQVSGDRKFNLAASYGYYGGSHAVAVGFSGTNDKQNFTYKLSGAVNSKGNLAFGIGAGVMMGSVNDKDKVIEQLKEENRKRDEKIDKQGQEIKELKEMVNKLIRK
ncbi:YadA-like family protein [uncultured Sneathia sp.]|uniref:YadA-like family protein n=1 Tax=uncultured Sneathia sp. TaxID=278067 RepID=UPI00259BEA5B|nr:YadA-like family protein [uncultured Sneathia sp.]